MENKITKFIEIVVPTWPCNFRCHYCYVGQHANDKQRGYCENFQYPPAKLAEALNKQRLGGYAIINFCANGETLLTSGNLGYIKAMLQEGHYVMVVSNMTMTKQIEALL